MMNPAPAIKEALTYLSNIDKSLRVIASNLETQTQLMQEKNGEKEKENND